MKIQNTLTKEELKMVLQLCTRLQEDWREGQKFFNALAILKPALAKEIRTTALDPFNKDLVPAEIYAAICPDPPRMPEGFECPCCGRLLEELEEDNDLLKDEPKEIEPIHSCIICGQQLIFNEEKMCELCRNEYNEHLEENV